MFHPTALKFVARSGIVVKDRQLQSPHFEVLPVVILQLHGWWFGDSCNKFVFVINWLLLLRATRCESDVMLCFVFSLFREGNE